MSFDIRRASKEDLDNLNELKSRNICDDPGLAVELEMQHEYKQVLEESKGERDYKGLELWDLIPK